MNIWVAFLIGLILGWIIEWFIDWLFWRRDRVGDAADLQASRADIVAPSADVDVAAVEARWQQRMNEAAQQWQTRLNAVVQEQQARITALEEQNQELQAQLHTGARAVAPVLAGAAAAATAATVLEPPAEESPAIEAPAARVVTGAVAPAPVAGKAVAGAAVAATAAKSEPASVPADAWRGEYFNNKTLRGKPVLVREDAAIDFDWTDNPPAPRVNPDQFSARWTRMLDLPRGRYRFITTADDGVRLWVNDELLIDDWNDHPAQTNSREVSLPGGPVLVKLEYYENDFDSMVRLTWERAAASDLTKIRGIGPKFASLLTAAGVHTYDDLAALTPAQLEAIVQPAEWQRQQVNFDSWIAQAAALSRTAGPIQTGDDLTLLEGIGPTYAARLRENGITSFAQLATTDEETLAQAIAVPAWRKINYADWIAQARLRASGDTAAMKSLQEELVRRDEYDNLALIYGLGDKTAAALSGAGVTTFAALAATSPEQLDEIMRTAGVRGGDYAAWIDEAKVRAAGKRVRRTRRKVTQLVSCPQDLSAVAGIGSVYEDRLYTAGVGSYWELAETASDELSQILGIEDPDMLGQIKSSAMQLAVQTDTLGRAWDGTPPDDFEVLEGIGEIYERRLYEAGICTYEALAASTLERLQEICQAPEWKRPNYAAWIAKSTELAAATRSA